MQKTSIITLIALGALVAMSVPAHADSFVTISQPTTAYNSETTDYGGGNGSIGTINSLGPFSFSSALTEDSVPTSWSTWNTPPAVDSSTPDVLWTGGSSTLTLTISGTHNVVGFELEPDFSNDSVTATFYDGASVIDALNQTVDWNGGALLFALQDTSGDITSVVITDNTGGDSFAIAQVSAGNVTPEPGTLSLLGLGMLALAKRAYRRVKA